MLIEIDDDTIISIEHILYVIKKRLKEYEGPHLELNADKVNIIIVMKDGRRFIKKFVDNSNEMLNYWNFIKSFNDKIE